jgi:hypothetical protein
MSEETIGYAGKKAFVTTIISILLSPLSVALGYFLSHSLETPRLNIEYINPTFWYESSTLSSDILASIKANPDLIIRLKESLAMVSHESSDNCTGWLNEQPWSDVCINQALEAANNLLDATIAEDEAINKNVTAIEKWEPRGSRPPPQLQPMSISSGEIIYIMLRNKDKPSVLSMLRGAVNVTKQQIAILKKLIEDLQRIEKCAYTIRSGKVSLKIGFLNSGGRDGVVFNNGTISFGGQQVNIRSESYTVVKAHSFEEIYFEVDSSMSDKASITHWEDYVKNKKELKLEISVKAGDEFIKQSTTLVERPL